jgi:hypothetical protein
MLTLENSLFTQLAILSFLLSLCTSLHVFFYVQLATNLPSSPLVICTVVRTAFLTFSLPDIYVNVQAWNGLYPVAQDSGLTQDYV